MRRSDRVDTANIADAAHLVNCRFCGRPAGYCFLYLNSPWERMLRIQWSYGGWPTCELCRTLVEERRWAGLAIFMYLMGNRYERVHACIKSFKIGHFGNESA